MSHEESPSWSVGIGSNTDIENMGALNTSHRCLFISSTSARFMAQQLLLTAEKIDEYNANDAQKEIE